MYNDFFEFSILIFATQKENPHEISVILYMCIKAQTKSRVFHNLQIYVTFKEVKNI